MEPSEEAMERGKLQRDGDLQGNLQVRRSATCKLCRLKLHVANEQFSLCAARPSFSPLHPKLAIVPPRAPPRIGMYGNPSDVCILAGSGGDHLTEEVCGLLGVPSTSCTHKKSDGGEFHIAINESIRGRDAHIIQSTCHPVNDNIIELSLIVSALRRASAERVIAVVPYYGYGRQTRKMRSREPISAADVATILEDQGLDQIITVDLQHGQIAGFFSPRCSLDNLSVIPAVARFFWKRGLRDPVVRT